nr:MAG TPA: hypothetical protein [Caudoviricetes sp.]
MENYNQIIQKKIPESHYRDLSGDSSRNIPSEDEPLKGRGY